MGGGGDGSGAPPGGSLLDDVQTVRLEELDDTVAANKVAGSHHDQHGNVPIGQLPDLRGPLLVAVR